MVLKLMVLKKVYQGSCLSAIAREFGYGKTTVTDILKAREKTISLLHAEDQVCVRLPEKEILLQEELLMVLLVVPCTQD